jgi:hypothetical protein
MEKSYYLLFFMNLLQYNSFYYIVTLQKFSYQVWIQNTFEYLIEGNKIKLKNMKKFC